MSKTVRTGCNTPESYTPEEVTIRRARPNDRDALAQLAALDSRRPLAGDVLVAEVDGHLWAAVSVGLNRAIADPFRPTAGIVRLLRIRAAQLEVAWRADDRRASRRRPLAARRQTSG